MEYDGALIEIKLNQDFLKGQDIRPNRISEDGQARRWKRLARTSPKGSICQMRVLVKGKFYG